MRNIVRRNDIKKQFSEYLYYIKMAIIIFISIFFFIAIQCDTCEEYKACGPSNPKTCRNLCEDELVLPIKCVEGCFCPNNTVSHNGKCIKVKECPCYADGVEYTAGTIITIKNCQKW